jgi:hypothetical protein
MGVPDWQKKDFSCKFKKIEKGHSLDCYSELRRDCAKQQNAKIKKHTG